MPYDDVGLRSGEDRSVVGENGVGGGDVAEEAKIQNIKVLDLGANEDEIIGGGLEDEGEDGVGVRVDGQRQDLGLDNGGWITDEVGGAVERGEAAKEAVG